MLKDLLDCWELFFKFCLKFVRCTIVVSASYRKLTLSWTKHRKLRPQGLILKKAQKLQLAFEAQIINGFKASDNKWLHVIVLLVVTTLTVLQSLSFPLLQRAFSSFSKLLWFLMVTSSTFVVFPVEDGFYLLYCGWVKFKTWPVITLKWPVVVFLWWEVEDWNQWVPFYHTLTLVHTGQKRLAATWRPEIMNCQRNLATCSKNGWNNCYSPFPLVPAWVGSAQHDSTWFLGFSIRW